MPNQEWRQGSMRIFLAGASGAIGRRLTPLLIADGHEVIGTTRTPKTARELEAVGIRPEIVDVFDADALKRAVVAARPEVVIHQLTDLPREFNEAQMAAASPRNARIRVEGTRNLVAAAKAASAGRFIVQSIAFAYKAGGEPHAETDPLDVGGARAGTVQAVTEMEQQVLAIPAMVAVVLRYGRLYGPGTWAEKSQGPGYLHVDAAAYAASLAVTRGAAGTYNIAEDDGAVRIDKARRELGFDPGFRLTNPA
jgi:nucleoside-diphosphate-sugar epimerase